jgi:hypothetical protein
MDLDGPALKPPEGVTPNFDNPENGTPLVMAVTIISIVVSSLCMIVRAVARVLYSKKVTVADGKERLHRLSPTGY